MANWMTLKLLSVFCVSVLLPGWAFLAISGIWRQWKGLQRWLWAMGLGIAFYPILFYMLRFALPWLTLGPYKIGAILVVCLAVSVWKLRQEWRTLFALDTLEWVALAIFAMTLFTRIWVMRAYTYPAWSDSMHHALITRMVAEQGQLPVSLTPYFDVPLGQYHLGLYGLCATIQWLARVPAHTAVFWVAQILNGLCGLGVYLVLDRKVSRPAALIGAAVVGLLSHQPAFYVNWGRFTQIASQTILLLGWLMTDVALDIWKDAWPIDKKKAVGYLVAAAWLSSGIFLLHFRVAAFYLPLLALSLLLTLWQAYREHQFLKVTLGVVMIGVLGLMLVTPALWEAMRFYIKERTGDKYSYMTLEEMQKAKQSFHGVPWAAVPGLLAKRWLLVVAGVCALIGLWRRIKVVFICVLWVVALLLLGSAYRLGIPMLNVTNLAGVLIMLYLPLALVTGAGVAHILSLSGLLRRTGVRRALWFTFLLVMFIASHVRVTEIETYRFFIKPADLPAIQWIAANVPEDALFAVNTCMWLETGAYGTDAGYWLPYLTGHDTTAGVMLNHLGDQAHILRILELSRAVERAAVDLTALEDLHTLGVDYVYVGKNGDFCGPGFDTNFLLQSEDILPVYQQDSVAILEIK